MVSKTETSDVFFDHLKNPETLGRLYRTGIEKHVSDAKSQAIKLVAEEKTILECQKQIDVILVALDRIASCAFGCQGGAHHYEQLISKFCNHSNSVRLLGEAGFNDQAHACCRSMVEIVNLMTLFWFSTNDLDEFNRLDDKQRVRKFGPAQVRTRLENAGATSAISKEDYGRLSGIGIHPDISVGANHHNPDGLTYAIPKHQRFAFWILNYRNGYMCSLMAAICSDMKHIPLEVGKLINQASDRLSREVLPRLAAKLNGSSNLIAGNGTS